MRLRWESEVLSTMRILRKYVVAKLVSLCLVGTAWAQTPKVVDFAHAIAKAEGFGIARTIPTRCHNPGDLKGTRFDGQVGLCKGGHARFRDDAAGWSALYQQIEKMMSGSSKHYEPEMSLRQIARLYAGNSRVWLCNVTKALRVNPDAPLMAYFEPNENSDVNLFDILEDYDTRTTQ